MSKHANPHDPRSTTRQTGHPNYFEEHWSPGEENHPAEVEAIRRVRERYQEEWDKILHLKDRLMHLLTHLPGPKNTYLELEAADNHRQSLLEQAFYNLGVERGLGMFESQPQTPIERIRHAIRSIETQLSALESRS